MAHSKPRRDGIHAPDWALPMVFGWKPRSLQHRPHEKLLRRVPEDREEQLKTALGASMIRPHFPYLFARCAPSLSRLLRQSLPRRRGGGSDFRSSPQLLINKSSALS